MYCTIKGCKKRNTVKTINMNLNENMKKKKKNKLDFEEEYSRMKNVFFNV